MKNRQQKISRYATYLITNKKQNKTTLIIIITTGLTTTKIQHFTNNKIKVIYQTINRITETIITIKIIRIIMGGIKRVTQINNSKHVNKKRDTK
jgi:hypothetical protein